MASRSSSSTGSKRSTMSSPSVSSRSESPRRGPANPQAQRERTNAPSPSDKKHKSLAEVRATGRQSDQGGSPGRRVRGGNSQ